jgi:hypothetical protein
MPDKARSGVKIEQATLVVRFSTLTAVKNVGTAVPIVKKVPHHFDADSATREYQ